MNGKVTVCRDIGVRYRQLSYGVYYINCCMRNWCCRIIYMYILLPCMVRGSRSLVCKNVCIAIVFIAERLTNFPTGHETTDVLSLGGGGGGGVNVSARD